MLEHLVADHAEVADRLRGGWAAIDIEQVAELAVGAQVDALHAALARLGLFLALQHDRASAIAEENAGGAIRPVEDARECLRADHQRPLELSADEEVVGSGDGKDEIRSRRPAGRTLRRA